ncbi:MAG TPA: class I SAM-dependent methyltransferase [Verrucomicrobiae bacterium]|jgi:SAM-dependent methyltransferase|nr:class I SAM-dependent methyltransferase [Verrucomicrobiae bacterium]
MNWLVKAAAFKLLSALPGGPALYRYGQEHLTHSLVPTPERVGQKIDVGLQYWDWLAAHQPHKKPLGTHLDFGAGWHPTIPLLFYSLGVEQQHLVDVAPLLDRGLIESTVKAFLKIVTEPGWAHRSRLQRLPDSVWDNEMPWTAYLKCLGVTCHAPFTGAEPELVGAIDFATSTQVLYFIPREPLRSCFRQLHRVLKTGGNFLATIHLNDVNATWQKGLSQYNHLQYSPDVWDKWINSQLMSYNRLKAADYRQLLEEAGFQILHFDVTGPTAADLEELSRIPIHNSFSRYSREELGAKHLFFVAQKV